MVLPIDAIVPIYYSASVNYASSNNQALVNPLLPPPSKTATDKRFWEHFDITLKLPGLDEVLVLTESISIVKTIGNLKNIAEQLILTETSPHIRKFIPRIGPGCYNVTVAETLTLAESINRKTIPKISEILHLLESILRKPKLSISETLHLTESELRKVIRPISETISIPEVIKIGGQFVIMISETLHLAESVLRKPKPKIAGEVLVLTESFLRRRVQLIAETLGLSESVKKKVFKPISEILKLTDRQCQTIVGHGMHVFGFVFHDKWREITPNRHYIEIEESIKLDEKVETGQSGPSYIWKFAPVWKALGRNT